MRTEEEIRKMISQETANMNDAHNSFNQRRETACAGVVTALLWVLNEKKDDGSIKESEKVGDSVGIAVIRRERENPHALAVG